MRVLASSGFLGSSPSSQGQGSTQGPRMWIIIVTDKFTKQSDAQGLNQVIQNNPYRIHFIVQVLKVENSLSYLLKSSDSSNSRYFQVSLWNKTKWSHISECVFYIDFILERIKPTLHGLSVDHLGSRYQTGLPISVLIELASMQFQLAKKDKKWDNWQNKNILWETTKTPNKLFKVFFTSLIC